VAHAQADADNRLLPQPARNVTSHHNTSRTMNTHFVIIGNGAAGYRAAKAVRRADPDAQVSVFSDERYPFYLRRQLGDFLAGALSLEEVVFQSRNAYRRERIDLFLMTEITAVHAGAHTVTFASGPPVQYDRLLLATGTRAVLPAIPGRDLPGVATFDTLTEAVELRSSLRGVERAVILHEGIIGLSLAESLVGRGVEVTQLMPGDRFWPDLLDEAASQRLETVLEEHGVVLCRGAVPRAVTGTAGRCASVATDDGRTFPADLVACGCRRRPNVDLARQAGLEVGSGIRVDASFRTSRPDIWAAGDVAEPADAPTSVPAATPFCWQRAWTQGALAAASMLGRPAEPPPEAVRVRTEIFGHDLAVIGQGHLAAGGGVEVVPHDERPDVLRRLVYRDGRLIGAIVLGTGETVHELNRLVAEGAGRDYTETVLATRTADEEGDRVPVTFARHCPICAAELVVHAGTPAGSPILCNACNTDLVVCWDGRHGWLELARP
jgi:NAD(P)H-nitrite reductase large subunit